MTLLLSPCAVPSAARAAVGLLGVGSPPTLKPRPILLSTRTVARTKERNTRAPAHWGLFGRSGWLGC
jgi:hypothetical protein